MSKLVWKCLSGLVAVSSLACAPALGQTDSPYAEIEQSWVSISGTVDSVESDQFDLDYGQGLLTVEMDDVDREAATYDLESGDGVIVSGRVDDQFLGTTTLEASSLYIEKLGTTFYASGVEEQRPIVATAPVVVSDMTLRGLVSEVDPDANEFRVDTGQREITVDVAAMPYDPLDPDRYQQIEEGQYVSVTGQLDEDLFTEAREFEADAVVTLGSF